MEDDLDLLNLWSPPSFEYTPSFDYASLHEPLFLSLDGELSPTVSTKPITGFHSGSSPLFSPTPIKTFDAPPTPFTVDDSKSRDSYLKSTKKDESSPKFTESQLPSLPRLDTPSQIPMSLQHRYVSMWTRFSSESLVRFLQGPPYRIAIMLGAVKRRLPSRLYEKSKEILAIQVAEALAEQDLAFEDLINLLPSPHMWSTGPVSGHSESETHRKGRKRKKSVPGNSKTRKLVSEIETCSSGFSFKYPASIPVSIISLTWTADDSGTADLSINLNLDAQTLFGYTNDEFSEAVNTSIRIRAASENENVQLTPFDMRLFCQDDWIRWVQAKWDLWVAWSPTNLVIDKKLVISVVNRWGGTVKCVLTCRATFGPEGLPRNVIMCLTPLPI